MDNNQTNETLTRIAAKQKLGLPLTDRDNAILTLYGQPATDAAQPDDEYARKTEFVEKYLAPMLAAADVNVARATYRRHTDTHEEYVDVVYNNGYKRRVCVTANSLRAIVADVMSAI